jgi:hypothetical protein
VISWENSGFSWGLSGGFMGLSSEQEKNVILTIKIEIQPAI